MNRLLRDLFYAAAFGALIGSAIGLFIRRHHERKASTRPNRPRHAPELAARWHNRNPNCIQ